MCLYFYIYAFGSLTDRPTTNIFIEESIIYESNMHGKKSDLYLKWGPKNRVIPKTFRSDRHL